MTKQEFINKVKSLSSPIEFELYGALVNYVPIKYYNAFISIAGENKSLVYAMIYVLRRVRKERVTINARALIRDFDKIELNLNSKDN